MQPQQLLDLLEKLVMGILDVHNRSNIMKNAQFTSLLRELLKLTQN